MTKEKKTFAWDTILTMSITSNKMTVRGTNTEVKWCPATRCSGRYSMTTLAAKGYTTDGVPVYLWAYGNYRYEVEVKKLNFSDCEVFEGPYEDAVSRFEDRAINGVEMY